MSLANRLADLASTAEPPALDAAAARRMLDHAVAESRHVGSASLQSSAPDGIGPSRSRLAWLAVPALAVAAVLVLLFVRRPDPRADAPSHISLSTGDHLVGSPGARFDVEALTPADRRIRLRTGTMLFAVADAVPSQRFDVMVGDVVVRASRSVFSVDASGTAATIVVFQGDVQVIAPDATIDLRPGVIYRHDFVPRVAVATPAPTPGPTTIAAAADVPGPAAPAALPTVEPTPRPHSTVERSRAPSPSAVDLADDLASPTDNPRDPNDTSDAGPQPGDLALARAHVAARRYTDALDEARRAATLTGEWHLVVGDAQRGLGHPGDAADAFDQAARALTGAARAEAAYTAAYIRFRDLDQAAAALTALEAGAVDAKGSALEERGLALRVQILVATGRTDDAKARATAYLERFPKGGQSAAMRKLLAGN